ncbi:DUF3313 domain-containing protein [Zestomonas carbonaria]|uniref:DUF3313 domain-containing protein n=1 Tax=Zestomonas carbonaria TaxID=2762745 RepID=A0A7U7EM15_9GAMM|nr:DUF3313 domain-containing protein [Pseudomonas carbonaria]CAD5107447.1 hypothetical protein PSEWESI4_01720 [Pseudomonas carbonaria]
MKRYLQAMPLLMLAWLVGCADNQVKPDEYSGFLQDYSRLTAQENVSGTTVLAWVDPNLKLERYTSFYIEPVQYYPRPAPSERLSQQTLDGIASYYSQALKHELGQALPVVDSPNSDSLVLRPAITAVGSQTQSLKPYEVIPIALVAAGVSTAAGIRDQDTRIATEANFLDGDTSAVVAQVVRKGTGQPLESSAQTISVQDVKGVLDGWARDMRLSYTRLRHR